MSAELPEPSLLDLARMERAAGVRFDTYDEHLRGREPLVTTAHRGSSARVDWQEAQTKSIKAAFKNTGLPLPSQSSVAEDKPTPRFRRLTPVRYAVQP
jgi:hypothetical protein